MWWMVGLIVLAVLVSASLLVGYVFGRPVTEGGSAVADFDGEISRGQPTALGRPSRRLRRLFRRGDQPQRD